MCLEGIGLHAQNMIIILGSIVYIVGTWEDVYDRLMSLHLDNEYDNSYELW